MTERKPARELIREEGVELGWSLETGDRIDAFRRDGEYILMLWSESDPMRIGVGVARLAGSEVERDDSPLALVQARRWLGSKWV